MWTPTERYPFYGAPHLPSWFSTRISLEFSPLLGVSTLPLGAIHAAEEFHTVRLWHFRFVDEGTHWSEVILSRLHHMIVYVLL